MGVELRQGVLPSSSALEESSYPLVIPSTQDNHDGHQVTIPDPNIIWDMIGEVSQERILSELRRLTGVDPICTSDGCYTIHGRETASEDLQWAKDYIYEQLVSLGYEVEIF